MAQQLEVLNVQVRSTRGKREARRLRRGGAVPAVLYGHGEDSVSLSVPGEELEGVLRHGQRVVELRGGASDTAMIREMQWDTWGTHVLHLDFVRVSKDDVVELPVAVELRGEAPGVRAGGILEHLVHTINVRCPATAVPEKLYCNINHLELEGSITVAQLHVPEGVTVLGDPDAVVAQVVPPKEEVEEAAAPTEGAEPELIGRKPAEEEEAEER
jgi:large subunit ribosomal protein L25